MKAVIMAGGKGTRISSVVRDVPKPMIEVGGKPILEHEIECLRSQGITDLIITISHLGHMIENYFGDGSRFGVKIRYFKERVPLGNAGALILLREKLEEDFLLLNGDVVFDVDFSRMMEFHRKKGGYVTLFTHPNSHPYDSGLIIAEKDLSVSKWLTKEEERPQYYKNRVNGGIHIINPEILYREEFDVEKIGTQDPGTGECIKVDLDRQLLKPLAGTGKMFCYDSPEYVKDMGTPERLCSVMKDLESGVIQAKNLKRRQKAVFLDRDGTLNRYVGFLRKPEELELLEGVAEAVKKIHQKGYLCIVVTNQPVIARGEVTYSELEEIHNKMETLLGEKGAYVDHIYFCPHHPHKGFAGEVPELKTECSCRKPNPGMLLQAAEDYHISLAESWMAGDGENDILAGKNAGCKTALICGEEEKDYGQDRTASSLLAFASQVL